MTRQSTGQGAQRARITARRAKAAKRHHHLFAIGKRQARSEMARGDLTNWFVMAFRRLAKKGNA